MRATVSECHRMMEKFFEFGYHYFLLLFLFAFTFLYPSIFLLLHFIISIAQIMVAKLQDCQNSLLQLNEKTLSNHQRFSELHLDDKLKELGIFFILIFKHYHKIIIIKRKLERKSKTK